MKPFKIPIKELNFSFSRSSGPGGQNVNKVNSRATLKWNYQKTTSLPRGVLERLIVEAQRYVVEDEIVIHSQRFRDQSRNIADCVEKLQKLINEASVPVKKRKATKPTSGAIEKRLKGKKSRSEKKESRKKVDW